MFLLTPELMVIFELTIKSLPLNSAISINSLGFSFYPCKSPNLIILPLYICLLAWVSFTEVFNSIQYKDHIHDKVHKAYAMLGIIKRNFNYISINSFILLYKSMVRSLLDYCVPVWVPYKKGDIEVLEKVQKKATKIIPEIRHLPYKSI